MSIFVDCNLIVDDDTLCGAGGAPVVDARDDVENMKHAKFVKWFESVINLVISSYGRDIVYRFHDSIHLTVILKVR